MPKIVAKKQDWIKLGFKLFSEQGVSGIVIEKMAKKLNCNKSSFYWHFKTKKDFIGAMIDFWILKDTENIIEESNTQKSGKQKFEALIASALKKDPYLDFVFYLKRYGQKETAIQSIIDKIDNQRIDYVRTLLLEMGYSEQESVIKAMLFYKYIIGYHEMIRYKTQRKTYLKEAKVEINQFIKF